MKIVRKIYHGIEFLFTMLIFFASYPLAFILYGKKNYWLIAEIDFDAKDNGYHFFKYMNEKHKEINTLYIISKTNPNYELINNIGKTIEPHSYKHMLVFIAAKAKISTYVHGCSPNGYVTKYLSKFHGTGKNIALKHGIFKNLHPNYFKKNAHLDMICCGAKPEFDFIDSSFGYEKDVAKYTGLARFDALYNLEVKRTILIMPTWRRWLDNITNKEEFKNSEFFRRWNSLLINKNLLQLLDDHNLNIHFYVHPKLNKYLDCFCLNKKIKLFNSINGDSVQQQLKESVLLITDFSSVFFDFAYMRKPAIYYQFDEEKYYQTHYQKAYFDYRENGFGPVCTNEIEIVENIEKIINNNMIIKQKYLDRSNVFFPLCDNMNCERIYEAIKEVLIK